MSVDIKGTLSGIIQAFGTRQQKLNLKFNFESESSPRKKFKALKTIFACIYHEKAFNIKCRNKITAGIVS